MAKTKNGKYYLIDKVSGYSFIEVLFDGEEDRPLYKIFKDGKTIKHWRSDENLHEMTDNAIFESDDYQDFLDFVLDCEGDLATDLFGLPADSVLGTSRGNRELKSNKVTNVEYKKPIIPSGYFSNHYNKSYNTYQPKETTGYLEKLQNSNTLVIHCADNSTDMLSQIYEGKGWDVLTDGSIAESELHELIKNHERIVMLGHGSPSGLINVQYNKGGRFTVIDSRYVEDLKDKNMFVIWCRADEFFKKHNIGKGCFITGNIPSEVWECKAAGCGDITAELMLENITYWSKLCADVVEVALNGNPQQAVDYVRALYLEKYGDHPVTHYNAERTQVLK